MTKQLSIVVLGAVALFGCGGGAQVRAYKGTSTTAITSGGSTTTLTDANVVYLVMPGDQPNEWLFIDNNTSYSATASGMALTFQGNQGYSRSSTFNNQSEMVTVSNGTGQLSAESLSISISGTITQSSSTGSGSATYTLMFTGSRE
jgi:hypothetical protein